MAFRARAAMWFDRSRDLAICLVLSLMVWAPMGRWVLLRLVRIRPPGGNSIAIALGMGAWGLWILLLGATGLLYRSVLLVSAAGIILFLGLRKQFLQPLSPFVSVAVKRDKWILWVMGGIGLVYLVIVAASALAPEVAFDSLNVHLPYARDAASSHRAGFEPNNWSSIMPALPLMTYITAFVFSGVTLAKLFNALCFVLCAGVVFGFARRWWDATVAAAAALLFLSCPVALYEATTALIDLPLALFSALAVFALLEWALTGDAGPLRLSAVSLGLAMGCKYHAAFWLAPFAALILYHSIARRRDGPKRAAATLAQYLCIVFLLALPWLYRSWQYTGNPVFPAANGIFRSPYFTPEMAAAAKAAYANEGVGVSATRLALLPWTVTFHPGPFRGTLGLVFLPALLITLTRRMPQPVGYGLFLTAVYFYSWALTAQEIRYLLPLAPLVSLLSAAGLLAPRQSGAEAALAGSSLHLWRKAASGLASLAVLGGSLVALPWWYPAVVREWTYWHAYISPFPYLLGRETVEDFLKRDVPSIYVYDYINGHLDAGCRILLLNDAARFYSRVPTLYSFTVEAERFLLRDSEKEVVAGLAASHITHVLLNYNGIAPLPGVAPRRGVYFFLDKQFQERHLEPIFSSNKVVLYRFRKGPAIP